ncbi:conjugative transfer signal peptidase TraF [Halodesulfovibrio sp.]|uniref:conjugative transfer signal peptidase TraF n=1 Tax=Halodesulfovibrio sp. TaxID=1912772 RepID=UPI0025FF95D7|nr:conjugative transfer signal peptidase TraF [Halodesulfovibrio sp.]MCT4533770.1 conjugative transfer signal peptidase TraF [Halodesulfovibrio sp.]
MRKLIIWGTAALLLWCGAAQLGYRINATASEPLGLYRIVDETPQRNDLTTFCLAQDNSYSRLARERGYLGESYLCPSGQKPLLKEVAGLAGDSITVTASNISVNQKSYQTPFREKDRLGRTIRRHLKSGVIPEGKALLLSTHHPDSFDSRYFGLVDTKTLHKVIPVFTFN